MIALFFNCLLSGIFMYFENRFFFGEMQFFLIFKVFSFFFFFARLSIKLETGKALKKGLLELENYLL